MKHVASFHPFFSKVSTSKFITPHRKPEGLALKSQHYAAALLFAFALFLFALPVQSFAATQPIAAYGLNEASGATTQDQSGNNNHGTLQNGASWTSGKYAGGVLFDGSNDYVNMGDAAVADGLSAITVSVWVKFSAGGGGSYETHFVDKSQCSGYPGGGPWELGAALTQAHKAEFVIYPRNGYLVFSGASTTAVDDGNWHFIAGTYDGNRLSIWVDGVLENSSSVPGIVMASTSYRMELGGSCNGYSYPFSGSLDDVRVYDRALVGSELIADMNAPLGGGSTPPPADTSAPSVSLTAPAANATVANTLTVSASASDNVGVVGVKFLLDGSPLGSEDTAAPYAISWNTTSASNGTHTLAAIARDAAGNQSTSSTVSVTVSNDASAPSIPSGLRTTGVSTNSVGLAWTGSTDNVGVSGYRIFRNGNSIGTSSTTSYNDSGLSPSTNYTYTVSAFDAAGNSSSPSSGLSVTTASSPTPDTTPPSTPAGLRSTGATTSQISLAWNPSSDNVAVTGYRVFRNGSLVGSPASTSYTDSGLTANTGYVYTVSAVDGAGNASSPSSPLNASTSAPSSGGTYSTNFDSTENPISEGGKWHRANNAFTNVRTSGGIAYGTNGVTNGYDDSYALLSGFGPNQGAEATIFRSSSLATGITHEVELLLRFSDDTSGARGYEVLFAYYGGIQVVRWNGAMGDFTVLNVTGGPGSPGREFVSGDVVKATMIGNVISVYVNGVLMGQATDSAFSSGQPGMSFFTRPGGNSANYALTSYSAFPQ